ncbi:type II toxin-antitoxin system YafO family toxin [Neptunomonas japonica]|uniref:type II toxin-antitoxin system YafO family toxin n=1 Tax=Neptunomonas japonica TaxID=417574 RepID=UPI0006854DC9|nr:type II toxin-antitoxin system YafO family toxin [Neptunomonas japonica]
MIKVYCSKELSEDPEFNVIKEDFFSYIASEKIEVPNYFGKDVPYERPPSAVLAELQHIHLQLTPEECRIEPPLNPWDSSRLQFKRTSNKFLVYTRGEKSRNTYIILAIVFPRAHEKADSIDHMSGLITAANQAKKCF